MTEYVATEPLTIGLHRAHNPGEVVPEDNIERNGWQDKVARAGSAEAEEARASVVGYNPDDHTVAEVNEYLKGVTEEERDAILQAESEGQNRSGIVGS